MKKESFEKLQSRGYWRINFQPLVDEMKLKSLGDCRDIIEKNNVSLRGWNYPHFPRRVGDDAGLEPANNHYEGWIDWCNHKEFWRMYQSGQYLHYLALREDWAELNGWGIVPNQNVTKPREKLSIVGTIYEITEIFQFLSNLAQEGIYDEGVRVFISLHNTQDRKLFMEDPMRGPLWDDYKTNLEKIEFTNQYTKGALITKSQELAQEVILYFFDRFGWHKPPVEAIKQDQDNLLNRKF
jgi:hypothetical protein